MLLTRTTTRCEECLQGEIFNTRTEAFTSMWRHDLFTGHTEQYFKTAVGWNRFMPADYSGATLT